MHHLWRGARQVAKCIAVGTAVAHDDERAPAKLKNAPSLRLNNGHPFDSDLSAADFSAGAMVTSVPAKSTLPSPNDAMPAPDPSGV